MKKYGNRATKGYGNRTTKVRKSDHKGYGIRTKKGIGNQNEKCTEIGPKGYGTRTKQGAEMGRKRVRSRKEKMYGNQKEKKDSEIEMKRVRKSDRGGCGNWTNTGTEIGPKGYGHRTKKGTEIRRNRVRKAVQERCENRTIKGKAIGRKKHTDVGRKWVLCNYGWRVHCTEPCPAIARATPQMSPPTHASRDPLRKNTSGVQRTVVRVGVS